MSEAVVIVVKHGHPMTCNQNFQGEVQLAPRGGGVEKELPGETPHSQRRHTAQVINLARVGPVGLGTQSVSVS